MQDPRRRKDRVDRVATRGRLKSCFGRCPNEQDLSGPGAFAVVTVVAVPTFARCNAKLSRRSWVLWDFHLALEGVLYSVL